MKRALAVVLLALLALPLQGAIVPRMIGHWRGSYHGQPFELRMESDGTGVYLGKPIKWQVHYGQLQLDGENGVEIFAAKADAETLVLAGGEMAVLLVLVRDPDGPPAQTAAE